MKIMFVTNCNYHLYDPKNIVNILQYYWEEKGAKIFGIGKYNLHKFYIEYLRFNPDIIVTSWVPAAFVPVFFKKLGLVKCPIVHRWEDYYVEMMTNYPSFLVGFMEKFTAKNADYIITVLKTRETEARKMGKTTFLLPYGITARDSKKSDLDLSKLKTKKGNLIVIYSGSQERWKRVDRIINAVKGEKCDLFLIGTPNPENQKLAEEHKNIHFMGFRDSTELSSILKQADILVNTADHDMCMKFLDYISVNKPILAYNKRSVNFFVHKKNAYLTSDFKKGLRELINDKKLREKLIPHSALETSSF